MLITAQIGDLSDYLESSSLGERADCGIGYETRCSRRMSLAKKAAVGAREDPD